MKKKSLSVGSLKPGSKVKSPVPSPTNISIPKQPEQMDQSIRISQGQSHFSITPVKHTTLLSAALEQKQSVEYKCMKGTCGKCTVKVLDGQSLLSAPNQQENKKLDGALSQGYRLACQAVIS
ncbi:2Fe-2S iron-sulfur cluster-binding protein [Ammoniphilus sp. CFH 90114]|uniref:2Fe-2S iron-sulfur cluster-binding protein n=1 Tax=Ammoniphilus sp. CFH 90114 TaxID=2493665 RepID=UPI00100F299A|nr:2Fe-2S iron-sulfur cluster-binding protein [Ammoniphilus sp. CFH 90114]RXT08759.1 (2Fe-2S)-binding protein [Ammoniphilus sp. CFH 90114]